MTFKSIKSFCLILLLAATTTFQLTLAFASQDEPFTGPANWGGTGLMEIPTARIMKKNNYRIGISEAFPYRYFYTVISPQRSIELGGRFTEIRGVPGFDIGSPYGSYKDKAVDAKFQFYKESKYLPAMAIGIMDPHGTRLYASQYLVFSKQIYPFDFTLGLGNGRFGKRPLPSLSEEAGNPTVKLEMFQQPKTWLKDSNFFWGIQLAFDDKPYALMLEYNPIKYHKQTNDPALRKYFQKPVASKFNYGVRYNFGDWVHTAVTYQRGDTIGFNISFPFEIGRPLIPHFDPPYREDESLKAYPTAHRVAVALSLSGFANIGSIQDANTLIIDLENQKYFYIHRAIEKIALLIAPLLSDDITHVKIILKEQDIALVTVSVDADFIRLFAQDQITLRQLLALSSLDTGYSRIPSGKKIPPAKFEPGLKPQWQLFLNDPTGFFKGKLGVSTWVTRRVWQGGEFVGGIGIYPLTNISTSNAPLSIPVRSDIVQYLSKKFIFERFMLTHTERIPETSIFGRLTAGILEMQYAGAIAEVAKPFFDGQFLAGLSTSVAKKRDPDNPLAFKKNDVKNHYSTAFINTRFNHIDSGTSVDIKYGRFLAGDVGAKIMLSQYIKGATISVWYSMTDTSVFTDGSNRNYHDKGILFSIPIRYLLPSDSRQVFWYGLSAWTRDVAQDIDYFSNLFDFIGRSPKKFIKKDLPER